MKPEDQIKHAILNHRNWHQNGVNLATSERGRRYAVEVTGEDADPQVAHVYYWGANVAQVVYRKDDPGKINYVIIDACCHQTKTTKQTINAVLSALRVSSSEAASFSVWGSCTDRRRDTADWKLCCHNQHLGLDHWLGNAITIFDDGHIERSVTEVSELECLEAEEARIAAAKLEARKVKRLAKVEERRARSRALRTEIRTNAVLARARFAGLGRLEQN